MTNAQSKNNTTIRQILEDGETLEWSGTSASYPILTAETKKGLMIRWGLSIVCIILWAIYCIAFHNAEGASAFGLTLSMILVILFFAYISFQPVLDRRKITEKNSYYLTNRHAIVLDGSDAPAIMNLYGVKASFLPAEEGKTTLLLQSDPSAKPPKNLRTVAWKPFDDGTADAKISDMVFYNVESAEALTRPFH